MDKRGLAVDPNYDVCEPARWFDKLGPTQRPSPYATASWVCHQKYEVIYQLECGVEETAVFDNYTDFTKWLYEFVLDGGSLSAANEPRDTYDSGFFTTSGSGLKYIKRYFASVRVYDTLASYPDFGHINEGSLVVLDNGDNIQLPIPNPEAIYDGGEGYHNWGATPVFDGGGYTNNGTDNEIIDTVGKDDPPGELLGEINYEMVNCEIFITDWSHYNWMDDTPVRKAFKCLVSSRPSQVRNIFVANSPHAFWTSLGFATPLKGGKVLSYFDPTEIIPY